MVHMATWLAESGENLVKMWELVTSSGAVSCSSYMQNTEIDGAVIKTPLGVEFTCSSGNRLLDHALVDR